MLHGHNVKDDVGYSAALTEQGASASQVAAATPQDTTSKVSGMAGEANDAVSISSHAGASVRSLQIIAISRKRSPTSVDESTTKSKIETVGRH